MAPNPKPNDCVTWTMELMSADEARFLMTSTQKEVVISLLSNNEASHWRHSEDACKSILQGNAQMDAPLDLNQSRGFTEYSVGHRTADDVEEGDNDGGTSSPSLEVSDDGESSWPSGALSIRKAA
ncbi:hypothetical protein CSUB01_01262 [Colletotrichum sublineola]|uniref:Uncharacterized protein n=1 Tax=Colletotrichum sublineola TaxID=1173701 RepID=A0A066XMV8_COLSU|nr:hypothetical protein CSUB01_01262 [Colletotrichum sublineola]